MNDGGRSNLEPPNGSNYPPARHTLAPPVTHGFRAMASFWARMDVRVMPAMVRRTVSLDGGDGSPAARWAWKIAVADARIMAMVAPAWCGPRWSEQRVGLHVAGVGPFNDEIPVSPIGARLGDGVGDLLVSWDW